MQILLIISVLLATLPALALDRGDYSIYQDQDCTEGFIEGRIYQSSTRNFKNCLNKKHLKLRRVYETDTQNNCQPDFVTGRSYSANSDYKLCLNQLSLVRSYQGDLHEPCAQGFMSGRYIKSNIDYKICLKKDLLPFQKSYEIDFANECLPGFVEEKKYSKSYSYKVCRK